MKKLLYTLTFAITIVSCNKDNSTSPDKKCDTGTVQFINNSKNPYKIYVDNSYLTSQDGKSSMKRDLSKGFHKITVEQISGYLFTPTIQDYEFTINGCDEKIVSYP